MSALAVPLMVGAALILVAVVIAIIARRR